jgi:DNA-binding response OmpR family regulator
VTEQERILVVEDDPDVADVIKITLEDAGFEILTHDSAVGVAEVVGSKRIDLVLLDLGLPGGDGLDLLRQIKSQSEIGVMIVSGLSGSTEKIVGLEIGADDYLTKPFVPRELLARVRSVLRRLPKKRSETAQEAPRILRFESFSLNETRMEVLDEKGRVVPLTSGEYGLLEMLTKHPRRVLTRDQLLELTHGNDFPAFDRSIDVLIARLRKKLGDCPPVLIKTVRNRGYIFTGAGHSN